MSLASVTITYDLANLVGAKLDAQRTKVWATTNVPGKAVVDTDGNKIRLGDGVGTIAADGTGSISLWVPGAGSNPASWQTTIHVDYVYGKGQRTPEKHETRDFGPFTITAAGDLADLIAEQEVPPTYLSTVTALLDGYVDDAEAAASESAASAAAAQASEDAAQALVLSDLGTTDGQTRALIENPASQTAGALSATIDTQVPRVAVEVAQQFSPIASPAAAPCLVTSRSAASATTAVPSARAAASGFFASYAPNDLARFTYLGSAPTFNGGATFPDNSAVSFDYVDGAPAGLAAFKAEMQHTGRYLEFVIKTFPSGTAYWIWVDGRPLTLTPVNITGGNFGFVLLDFGAGGGTRKVEFRAVGTKFFGANVDSTSRILATTRTGPRGVVLSDSYGGGANGTGALSTFPAFLSAHLQVPDLWNLSIGSTGWLAPGVATKARDRINQVIALNPDFVVIALGHNDENAALYPRAALTTEVDTYLDQLRAALPNTQIIVTGPLTQGANTAAYVSVQDAIFAGAVGHGETLLDTITLNPFTGTGHAGAKAGDGNSDLFISNDTVHPTQDGHAWLAWWMTLKLRVALLVPRFASVAPPAPLSGLPFSDDFNRANSTTTLGPLWSALSGVFGILNNKAYLAASTGGSLKVVVHDAEVPDVRMDAVVAGTSGDTMGFAMRVQGSLDYYYVDFFDAGAVKIKKYVAGAVTQLATLTLSISLGDTMGASCVGNTLKVYRNGAEILSATDSTFLTQTRHGLWTAPVDNSKLWDNFTMVAA